MVTINTTKLFDKNLKALAKKYVSLDKDYEKLLNDLKENPLLGTDLGGGLRKVRMTISAKGKGKSGGARVITSSAIISINERIVTLLTIYDKSEVSTIKTSVLKKLKTLFGL